MTEQTERADRYLGRKIDAFDREEAATLGFAPEASEYMDDLSSFELSDLPRERRTEYLEAAVRALLDAMDGDGVADRSCGVRRAVAFGDDEPVVAVIDGFGEVISLDRETAALVAFAAGLEPESASTDDADGD